MAAGNPPMVTWTSPSPVVGNGIPAVSVEEARFEPYNVSSSPGAILAGNGALLAAFTIPVGFRKTPAPVVGAGACKATLRPRLGPIPDVITTAPPSPTM